MADVRRRQVVQGVTAAAAAPESSSRLLAALQGTQAAADTRNPDPSTYTDLRTTSFQHNGRMWLAFLPCLLVFVAFGGKTLGGITILGLLATYIADSLGSKDWTLAGIWFTVITVNISLVYLASSLVWMSLMNLMLVYMFNLFTLMTGLWVTLQFHWIVRENPKTAIMLERFLMAVFPVQCFAILAWGLIGMAGPTAAPYYLALIGAILVEAFSLPNVSSFRYPITDPKGTNYFGRRTYDVDQGYVLGKFEVSLQMLFFLYSPIVVYILLNFFAIWADPTRVADIALLIAIPFANMYRLSKRGLLWVADISETDLEYVQKTSVAAVTCLLLLFVEVKVIFKSFKSYIVIPFPLNVVVVTAGLLASAGVFLFSILNTKRTFAGLIVSLVIGAAGTAALCYAAQLGIMYTVALEGSVLFLIAFIYQRNFWQYMNFALCATIAFILLFDSHAGFLKFSFQSLHWSFSTFGLVLLTSLIIALIIPAFLITPDLAPQMVSLTVNVSLVIYTVLFVLLEGALYMQHENMYPMYWMIGTSGLGLYLTQSLFASKQLSPLAAVVLGSLYTAKLSLLVVSSSWYAVPWTAALLAIVAHLDLAEDPKTFTARKGLIYAGLLAVAAFFASTAVPAHVLALVLRNESTDFSLAAWCLTLAAALSPLSTRFFPDEASLRRVVLVLGLMGVLLAWLQPIMDVGAVFQAFETSWSVGPQTILKHGSLNSSIWTPWVLVALLAINGLYLATPAKLTATRLGTLATATTLLSSMALSLLYLWGALYPRIAFLGGWIFGSYALVIMLVIGLGNHILIYQERSEPMVTYLTFYSFLVALPFVFRAQNKAMTHLGSLIDKERRQDVTILLLGAYVVLSTLLALLIKVEIDTLAAKRSSASSSASSANFSRPSRSDLRDRALLRSLPSASAVASGVQSSLGTLEHLAHVSNTASVVAFALAMHISLSYFHAPLLAPVALSPLFLLLSKGPTLATSWLNATNRYGPVVIAAVASLIGRFCYVLYATSTAMSTGTLALELVALVLTLPPLFSTVTFTLDLYLTASDQSFLSAWWTAPIALFSLAGTSSNALQVLAVIGIVGSIVRQFVVQRRQRESLRVL